jgi:hypothetical protein
VVITPVRVLPGIVLLRPIGVSFTEVLEAGFYAIAIADRTS